MRIETFRRRLEDGKSVDLAYRQRDREGLIAVWRHEGRFILTWEECASGDQLNESNYLRDERHEFETSEAVLSFLQDHDELSRLAGEFLELSAN